MPSPSAPIGQVLEYPATIAYLLVMDGRLTLRFGSNILMCIAAQEGVNEDEEERIVSLRNLMPECIDLLCPVLAIQPELAERVLGLWM